MRNDTLLSFAALAALSISTASANPITLTGNYWVSETYSPANGGPSVSRDLPGSFTIDSLTIGTETTPVDLFTADPAGGCTGGGCSNSIETAPLTLGFSSLDVSGFGIVSSLSEDGTFTAKYSGAELSCAAGDGVSPPSGETDCLVWQGASDTWNGYTMLTGSLGNGYNLDVYVYNATDWDVTPQIGFEVVDAVAAVPEPGSLALLALGLGALALVGTRRRAAR